MPQGSRSGLRCATPSGLAGSPERAQENSPGRKPWVASLPSESFERAAQREAPSANSLNSYRQRESCKVITKSLTSVVKRTHGGFVDTLHTHSNRIGDRQTAEAAAGH
jgi:hypothetical protein